MTCPCGGADFESCCGPILAGAPAVTAEQLMRSRFTAFARGEVGYLRDSWHPATRPRRLDLDEGLTWRRLQIVATGTGGAADQEGWVEFRASYRTSAGAHGVLHERSRFRRTRQGWRYLDGEFPD